MPKIVDKFQKRQNIALSSIDLFVEKGFHKLTVSEVAKNANIAKGTIYKYFENKEDIVFAIIEYAQESYDKEVIENIKSSTCVKDKIFALFSLCISQTKESIKRRKIYKEYIAICLDNPSKKIIEFQKNMKIKYTQWLDEILTQGIKDKQLKKESLNFTHGLYAIGENVLLFSHLDNYNDENMLQKHIMSLLELIKIGDCNNH